MQRAARTSSFPSHAILHHVRWPERYPLCPPYRTLWPHKNRRMHSSSAVTCCRLPLALAPGSKALGAASLRKDELLIPRRRKGPGALEQRARHPSRHLQPKG